MLVEETQRMNYYHILGVSEQASSGEIKTAYRKLAVRYHPDKNAGSIYAETRFKEISEAYRILSDPEKRARYDIMVVLEEQERLAQQHYQQRRRRRPHPGQMPPVRRGRINSRENIVATAWAIGIFIVIAIIGAGLYQYKLYQLEQEELAQLEDAKRRYEQVEALYQAGAYEQVLAHIQILFKQGYYSDRGDNLHYLSLIEVEAAGQRAFNEANYKDAAHYFQVYADYQKEYKPEILARLVISYQNAKQFRKAVQVYKNVIKQEPATIEARVGLANLYAIELKDFENALTYYSEASDIIEKDYIARYGKAFPLAMNPMDAPESHYDLHCGLARVFISMGKLKQAELALEWAMFLRPNKAMAYYLIGLKHREARELEAACEAMRKAGELGYAQAAEYIPILCKSPINADEEESAEALSYNEPF